VSAGRREFLRSVRRTEIGGRELPSGDIGLRSKASRELRLRLGKDFEDVWLGFMSKTPRWRLSGEALSNTFGAGSGACSAVLGT